MLAVNITNGKIVWATPFIDYGTVLPVKVPDTHDWDTSWGSSVVNIKFDNGTQKKIVLGHDKMGNIMAMDSANGKPLWWRTLGKQINTDTIPLPDGSGLIWSYGIFNYHAVDDNNSIYLAAVNRGVNYFTDEGQAGHRIAAPHTIELGLKNGTIAALDIRNGNIKWQYPTEYPPRVSPLVSNGIVFAGVIPFTENTKANTNHTTITKRGLVLALDKDTGKKLWEFNVNAPLSAVGPSIGDGMLFIPTGKLQKDDFNENDKVVSTIDKEKGAGGSIIAFGL
jgi:outer membrane protein assembly factor BamB